MISRTITWPAALLVCLFATEVVVGDEYTSGMHGKIGLACAACHGDEAKKSPVAGEKCLECHTSFAEVAHKTTTIEPNPHANHYVKVGSDDICTECHKGHKADEITCRQCHAGLTFKGARKENRQSTGPQ